jgi:hypothetical protein
MAMLNMSMKKRTIQLITLIAVNMLCWGCEKQNEPTADQGKAVESQPVFKRISPAHSGVTFKNSVDENASNFFDVFAYVYNGGGVGIGDINNDGLADIYFQIVRKFSRTFPDRAD